jgi:hypothetical protein
MNKILRILIFYIFFANVLLTTKFESTNNIYKNELSSLDSIKQSKLFIYKNINSK